MNKDEALEKKAENARELGLDYEPEQEPKCGAIIEVFGKDWRLEYMSLPVGKHKLYTQQYTYTTPPQRTWVGLTPEERDHIWNTVGNSDAHGDVDGRSGEDVMDAIEAKLKEKNT
jgi:hypothetical protein